METSKITQMDEALNVCIDALMGLGAILRDHPKQAQEVSRAVQAAVEARAPSSNDEEINHCINLYAAIRHAAAEFFGPTGDPEWVDGYVVPQIVKLYCDRPVE